VTVTPTGLPRQAVPSPSWKVLGRDSFAGDVYSVGHAESREAAEAVARAYLEQLAIEQPSTSSGGQADAGIQDHVYIVAPDGVWYRYLPAAAP